MRILHTAKTRYNECHFNELSSLNNAIWIVKKYYAISKNIYSNQRIFLYTKLNACSTMIRCIEILLYFQSG